MCESPLADGVDVFEELLAVQALRRVRKGSRTAFERFIVRQRRERVAHGHMMTCVEQGDFKGMVVDEVAGRLGQADYLAVRDAGTQLSLAA